jgi:serine-type D-Ala-D-Ala carboxypeptidase/endopeptidase (penicillin-binding protein 4)
MGANVGVGRCAVHGPTDWDPTGRGHTRGRGMDAAAVVAALVLASGAAACGATTAGSAAPAAPAPAPPAAAAPAESARVTVTVDTAHARLAGLDDQIRAIIDEPPLQQTQWGIAVYDPASDRRLIDINGDKHFVPASNNKLLTTVTAMARLGPEFRYQTPILALGRSRRRARALLVQGRGDPTLSQRFGAAPLADLDSMADSVYTAGIRDVTGPLIVDATYFDSTLVNPTWQLGDLVWSYAAPVTAFAASEGSIPVVLQPADVPGKRATVRFLGPPGLATVRADIITAPEDSTAHWTVRRLGRDSLVFDGTIRAGSRVDTTWIAAVDPAEYAGRALLGALRRRGVQVHGGLQVVRDTTRLQKVERRYGTGTSLFTWTSPPLDSIVQGLLRPSQNWIAESLMKTLGAQTGEGGTWRDGIDVVRRFLVDDVGIDSLSVHQRDGSGLSAQDLVTPDALVKLLAYVQRQPWGQTYQTALAAPGIEGSTLQRRLMAYRGRLFAKTGTIANVNSLSGYLVTDSGRTVIFSILSNGSGVPSRMVRHATDRIIETIASEGGVQ